MERGTFFLLLRLFFVKFMWNFCVPNGTHPLFQKVALPSSRLHFKTGGSFFYNRTTYSCQWLSSLSLQNLILDPKVKGGTNILWQWTLIAWQRGARCNNTATRLSDPSFHHFSSYHWKHKLLEKGVPFLNPFLWCMHLHRVKCACGFSRKRVKGDPHLLLLLIVVKNLFQRWYMIWSLPCLTYSYIGAPLIASD